MERRTPENNDNNNIWKIPIRLTSVGLAHARPKYSDYVYRGVTSFLISQSAGQSVGQ